MKSVTQLKNLGDMRTTISTHARSTPRLKGSTYLEVYLLDKERQRLETEREMLAKRQQRIEARLEEIRQATALLLGKVEQSSVPPAPLPPGAEESGVRSARGKAADVQQWKTLAISY